MLHFHALSCCDEANFFFRIMVSVDEFSPFLSIFEVLGLQMILVITIMRPKMHSKGIVASKSIFKEFFF
jgi:hypothetical protein